MEKIQNILYVIAIVIYYGYTFYKKHKKQTAQELPIPQTPARSAPQEKKKVIEVLKEPHKKIPAPVVEKPSDERFIPMQREVLEHTPMGNDSYYARLEAENIEQNGISYTQEDLKAFKHFDLKKPVSNKYGKLLRNKQQLKNAFVLSEVLSRKW